MPSNPARALRSLRADFSAIEQRFLQPHLAQGISVPPPFMSLDLRAFVVLTHSTLESFFETTADWLLSHAVRQHTLRQRESSTVLALVARFSNPKLYDTSSNSDRFTRIKGILDVAKQQHSSYIRTKNHGASEEYLREIFYPLGLDLPAHPGLLQSINRLAELRGDAAHLSPSLGAITIPNPADLQQIMQDSLKFAEEIFKRSLSMR